MRRAMEFNLDRRDDEPKLGNFKKRLEKKKECNISNARTRNKIEKAISDSELLIKSGRLESIGEIGVINTEEDLVNYMDKAIAKGEYAFDVETTGLDVFNDIIVGICLYVEGERSVYVPINHTNGQNERVEGQLDEEVVKSIMTPYFEHEGLGHITHNGKFDGKVIRRHWGVKIKNFKFDTLIGSFLLNENEPHGLKVLHDKYIMGGNGSAEDFGDLFGNSVPFNYVPIEVATVYGANDGIKTFQLYQFQKQYITKEHSREDFRKMTDIFYDIEMRLIPILIDVELRGVEIRDEFAEELRQDYIKRREEALKILDEIIKENLGEIEKNDELLRLIKGTGEINYNSPKQVQLLIYDVWKLRSGNRKTPRGTGENILRILKEKYKEYGTFFEHLLNLREINKMLSTYVEKIPQVKEKKTGAVHTNFNQLGAKTGRFSSSHPIYRMNLQNIPSKEKRIRKIFRARDGYKMVGGDFSQIEPRTLASMSKDEGMIESYRLGRDLYAWMGSMVYKVPYEDCLEFREDGTLNPEGKQRRDSMKSVLLGIMYERGAKAIGDQFGKSEQWGQELVNKFLKSFPKIEIVRATVVNQAENFGYVNTLQGRKRRLPDMKRDRDDYRYTNAHRQCLNAVIQGTAGDIMKKAMINIGENERLKELGFHMLMTIHDEVIAECNEENLKEAVPLFIELMKKAGEELLNLPMSVDAEVMDYWNGEDIADRYI